MSQTVGLFRSLLLFVVQADPFLTRPTTVRLRRHMCTASHIAGDVEKPRKVGKHTGRASGRSAGRALTGQGRPSVSTRAYGDRRGKLSY